MASITASVSEEQRTQLGRRLKMWRKFRGLTQTELANMSGCRQSAICLCERGDSYPADETILRIADALKVRPQLLEDRKFTDVPGVWYGSVTWKLLTGDWRLYTIDEIAAEIGVKPEFVEGRLSVLKHRGYEVLYTHCQCGTGKRLDPPVRTVGPREAVKHSHCKGCRYGLTKGAAMPSGCLYYAYTGKHRPNPVNGRCPAKDTSRRTRNVYKGAR